MNKEHVFNIAISIDDDAIAQKTTEFCAKEVQKSLQDGFFRRGNYGHTELDYKAVAIIEKETKDFIERYKTEIICEVINRLTDKAFRSKAFREAMQKMGDAG